MTKKHPCITTEQYHAVLETAAEMTWPNFCNAVPLIMSHHGCCESCARILLAATIRQQFLVVWANAFVAEANLHEFIEEVMRVTEKPIGEKVSQMFDRRHERRGPSDN